MNNDAYFRFLTELHDFDPVLIESIEAAHRLIFEGINDVDAVRKAYEIYSKILKVIETNDKSCIKDEGDDFILLDCSSFGGPNVRIGKNDVGVMSGYDSGYQQ